MKSRDRLRILGCSGLSSLLLWASSGGAGPYSGPILNESLTAEVVDVVQVPASAPSRPLARINLLREVPDGSGRLFVNDLNGPMHVIDGGSVQLYLDLAIWRPDLKTAPGLGSGFVSFAFHPEFASNGIFYTAHSEFVGVTAPTHGPAIATTIDQHAVLTEWVASDPSANSFTGSTRELIRIASPHRFHNFGEIAFNPNAAPGHPDHGLLYIGAGDFGSVANAEPNQLQRLDTLFGAVLRIDPKPGSVTPYDYAIPTSNPHALDGDPNTFGEIYAHGFRNGHRFAWDTGGAHTAFVFDIGESHLEEIDVLSLGANYGWPEREGSYALDAATDPSAIFGLPGNDASFGFSYPVAQYDHDEGLAIAGGFVYRADPESPLYGKLIFGDIANGRIFHADVADLLAADDGDPATTADVYELNLLVNGTPTTLHDIVAGALGLGSVNRVDLRFGMASDGALYVTTKQDGFVRRLIPETSPAAAVPSASLATLLMLGAGLAAIGVRSSVVRQAAPKTSRIASRR